MPQFKPLSPTQEEYDSDHNDLNTAIAALRQQVAAASAAAKRTPGTGTPYTAPVIVTGGNSGGSGSSVTLNTPPGLLVNGAQGASGAMFSLASGITGILLGTSGGGFAAAVAGTDYVAPSETIATTGGIVGGGDLSDDLSLELSNYSTTVGDIPSSDGAGGLTWGAPVSGGGTRGSLWYEGTGAPGTITGVLANDLYLNTANGDVYQYTTSWGVVGNIKGAAGANGTNGTNGTNGVGVPAGGTTGQILAKNSGTDYDTLWEDPCCIFGVAYYAAISGGGIGVDEA